MDPAEGVGVLAAAGRARFVPVPCVLPLVPGYLSAVTRVEPGAFDGAQAGRVLVP